MNRTDFYLYGRTKAFQGLLVGQDSIHALTHYPLQLSGPGVHRLALRCLFGEWQHLALGPIYDVLTGRHLVAEIQKVSRVRPTTTTSLGRPLSWRQPSDYFLIEADSGTWILKESLFEELAFGADGNFYLAINGLDFAMYPRTGESHDLRTEILAKFPAQNAFTAFSKATSGRPTLGNRFEFAKIEHLLDAPSADRVFSNLTIETLANGKEPRSNRPSRRPEVPPPDSPDI